MKQAHNLNNEESRKLDILYRATGIQSRYTTISDYTRTSGFDFFPDNKTLEPFPETSFRSDWYCDHALDLSKKAVRNSTSNKELSKITHLITVSCTGMYTPGLDIELLHELELSNQIERTSINFMGCYAAFTGLKMAYHICNSRQDAHVLLVCTELCSLHFQKDNTEDNLLANALFGDGSAAAIISSTPSKGFNLNLTHFFNDLLPSGAEDMAWKVGNHGFEMKLSKYVPALIKKGIQPLLNRLKEHFNPFSFDYYAIHPGGKKILQAMEETLGINKQNNRFSHEVLKNYGNMSSPTILFVLHCLMNSLTFEDDKKSILAFAFGPGLTLESGVFQVVHQS